jgi:hypothetical protein
LKNIRALSPLLSIKIIFSAIAVLGIASCWQKPPMIEEPIKRYWEVEAPLELIWKTSVQALVDKGVSISIIDKANNLMVVEETLDGGGFKRVTAEKGYFYGGMARVTLLFTEKSQEKTGININTTLQGFTGRYYAYVTSNGNLEKDYFLLISNNLPIKRTYKWLEEDKGKAEKEKEEIDEGTRGAKGEPKL